MLSRRLCQLTLAPRSRQQTSLLASRTMSTAPIYVLPIQPSSSKTSSTTPPLPISPQKLWSSVPQNATHPSSSASAASGPGSHIFFAQGPNGDQTIALSSLGKGFDKKNANEKREVVRRAVGSAVGKVKGVVAGAEAAKGVDVRVDAELDPHAAGTSRNS